MQLSEALKPNTISDVVNAVNDHLRHLNTTGGELSLSISKNFHGESRGFSLRASSAGKCGRALAFEKLYPEDKEPLTNRAYNVFWHGDVLHSIERELIAKVASLHSQEMKVQWKLSDEVTISGHIDGLLELAEGAVLIDVKSASTYSFRDMKTFGAREDYKDQMNVYLDSLNLNLGYLWLYNKDTSERFTIPVYRESKRLEKVRERFESVLLAKDDNTLPERMYAPEVEIKYRKETGREYLPWQCSYCPFTARCWTSEGFEKVIEGGKPRWIKEAVKAVQHASE